MSSLEIPLNISIVDKIKRKWNNWNNNNNWYKIILFLWILSGIIGFVTQETVFLKFMNLAFIIGWTYFLNQCLKFNFAVYTINIKHQMLFLSIVYICHLMDIVHELGN